MWRIVKRIRQAISDVESRVDELERWRKTIEDERLREKHSLTPAKCEAGKAYLLTTKYGEMARGIAAVEFNAYGMSYYGIVQAWDIQSGQPVNVKAIVGVYEDKDINA